MRKKLNPMTIKDLSLMYKVSPSKMRVVVSRSEFAKFDLGKIDVVMKSRGKYTMKALCYNCDENFHALMKACLSR